MMDPLFDKAEYSAGTNVTVKCFVGLTKTVSYDMIDSDTK